MGDRFLNSVATLAITAAAVGAVGALLGTQTSAQDPTASVAPPTAALKTSWGEPDLQGIWTDEFDTPLQRPAKYADQEFFTEAQRAELDKERSAVLTRFATEKDINGAYNAATFFTTKHTGARTSKIVDPPNGRIPPQTPAAQQACPLLAMARSRKGEYADAAHEHVPQARDWSDVAFGCRELSKR